MKLRIGMSIVNDMRMVMRMAHHGRSSKFNFSGELPPPPASECCDLKHQRTEVEFQKLCSWTQHDADAVALGYRPSMMLLAWAAKAREEPLTMANTNKWHQWKLQSIQSVAMATPIYKSKASLWSFFSQLKVKKHQEGGLSTDQS